MSKSSPGGRSSIKDWPEDERPRERLLKYGPQALSHAELLAIFLRTGLAGKSARDLAQDLLAQFGGLRGLYAAEDKELAQIKGLGIAKIAQLRAAIELSKRYLAEELKEKTRLEHPQHIYELLLYTMRDLAQEEFKIILLNAQKRLIRMIDASQGSIDQSIIYPREVIKQALRYGAAWVVFAHNHPSGDPTPTNQDKALTRELVFACHSVHIRVMDHIIIGNNCYYSFTEAGLLKKYEDHLHIVKERFVP